MYYSHLLKENISTSAEWAFLKVASKQILRKAASTLIRTGTLCKNERNATVMKEGYDKTRATITFDDYDDYIFGTDGDDFILNNNRIVFGNPRDVTTERMDLLHNLVRNYAGDGKIIEFGSGSGRNLFHLRKSGITNSMLGLELSPVSVDMSKAASDHFDLPVDFETVNLCEPIDAAKYGPVDVIFSVHAFEMMPRIYTTALKNIEALNPKAIIFLEPIEELWPYSWRGILSRLRVRQLDRLRDLYVNAQKLGAIAQARGLRASTNPLNETSLLVIERSKPDDRAT